FFFFSSRRRHTRLQGDWSSDVCSSDLERHRARVLLRRMAMLAKRISERELAGNNASFDRSEYGALRWALRRVAPESRFPSFYPRSEERRVGKECRSWWSAYH